MSFTSNDLRDRIKQVFRDKWEGEDLPQYDELLDRFVFHMIDAADDLRGLADSLHGSRATDTNDLERRLHRFFLHALPHLVSAGQLYDYVPEIFPEQRGVHGDPDQHDEIANHSAVAQKRVVS